MNHSKDPFLEIAEGRVPLPAVLGAAPSVVGEGEPMRPDRSYTTLKWLSTLGGIFGLDHFYLRNPYSGLLKGLTFGGFLVWWLWDAAQLWTEKDRVMLYGLSAPFDLKMGFGQGTIADGTTHYEQRSDSAWWMLAALFSFIGADSMLLGNWGQMLRKLTEIILLVMFVLPLLFAWQESGIEGLLTISNIVKGLLAALIGFIVLIEWKNVVTPTFGDPMGMFKGGIHVSAKQDQVLNFQRSWVENIHMLDPSIQKQVMKDTGYTTISGEEMRKAFEVRYTTPDDKKAEILKEDKEAAARAAAAAASPIRWHWMLSYLVYLFGPLLILFQIIKKGIIDGINFILELTPWGMAKKELTTVAAIAGGENPMKALTKSIPGLEMVSGSLKDVAAGKNPMESIASAAGISGLAKQAEAIGRSGLSGLEKQVSIQSGGAYPTTQGMILGASVFALAGGAAIKLAVDYLLPTQ
jgi:TM2 domain-containing membrane protein YozV